jgi:UDP-N-acetylglucosamine:LPS N-acetylglucosamine transferase
VAGRDARVEAVQGLTRPEFAERREQADARAALALPREGRVVLVSGGGWGVGDLAGAVDVALELSDVSHVVCLCGRNEGLRAQLEARFASERRVRVLGFTEQMADWMAAADALVHSTGGLTVYEAYVRGCPTISYGWGRGHIRAHNEAFLRHGIADVATTPAELRDSLRRALVERKAPGLDVTELPSAASRVLALA